MNLKVSEEHAVRPDMAAQCMAFRLGCMRAMCGVQNTYEKAVFPRCDEYYHELASIERVWPRALALLLSFSGMRNEEVFKQKMLSAAKIPMQDFFRGFEVQTAEGLEGSGCPQSPKGEQESSDHIYLRIWIKES
eukprot:275295-Pelagomonas_calceolata.AAC.1